MSEDFDPPKEFDDYVILRELGRGQMGRVYLAEDAVLARPVAIKFIASVDPDLTARQSFLMEARAAARIQHPNVVSVYRVGELADRPYIVSELIRGKSLRESFPLAPGDVLGLAIDLARGLAAAHRRGVVHSDIKPGNAMVTEDGVAKLVDFGLAHVIQEGAADDATVIAVGTPDYMAPEVLKGRAASRRSDIYSFGAMIFEMVTGSPPGEAPDLTKLEAQLSRVVARCLESDADARFASGEELREALERLQQSRAFAIRVDENPYRGLRAFNADHRGLFFGRGLEVGAALERLRTESMLIVTGDSGVGKSSLIRAGVIPAILDGALGGVRTWEAVTFVPGRRPLAALAAALGDPTIATRVMEDAEALPRELRRRANDRGIVLFVDQMEELVTVGDPAEVAALEAGLARLSEGASHVRLIATVRADFLSKIANLPRLGTELARLLFFVSPLPSERLRDVITGPAGVTGFTFESEDMIGKLVDATANAGGGGLPLLSFALAELWEARDRDQRVIKASALELMGGVAGALARHGDATIASMPALERAAARRVLLRLVTSLGTRVRRSAEELAVGEGARAALDELVRGRLVVVHDGEEGASFELAHEVLVRGWPTLRDWLEADAEASARRERVAASAAEWQRTGRGRDQLWFGPRLVEATSLESAQLTALEKEFIAASLGGMRRRIWMRRAAALSVVLFIAAGITIQRYLASHRLADTVAEEVTGARIVLAGAHLSDQLQSTLAETAYARFDRGQPGEEIWARVVAARIAAETAYRFASSKVEAALAKDPTRADVRALLGAILYDRAGLAETIHELDSRDEMLSRMAAYDADGSLGARWSSNHAAAPHDAPTKVENNFVYIPAGSFLFGSSADEDTRISFFQTVPIHMRSIGAYAIARTETTIGEWIEYVEAKTGAVMPSQPAKMTGALAITPDGQGHYKIAMQPMQRAYTAGWNEPLVYAGRASHAAQDWRKFPVTGVSAIEGEAYAAWLDHTGRVRGARLCNELEWERAARGSDGRSYPSGERAGDANVDVTYTRDELGPDEVGSHATSTSPFGVEDMSGNAFEWTRGERAGEYVARGGSYYHDRKTANVTNRYVLDKSVHDATLGIRICTTLPE